MTRFECSTLFDITETGTTGHCRRDRFPHKDKTGAIIQDESDWDYSRNQQRNLETILQILSLRTQITDVTRVQRNNNRWSFEFTVDHAEVFGDDLAVLRGDTQGVPMMIGLGEKSKLQPSLEPDKTIWFRRLENSNGQEEN